MKVTVFSKTVLDARLITWHGPWSSVLVPVI